MPALRRALYQRQIPRAAIIANPPHKDWGAGTDALSSIVAGAIGVGVCAHCTNVGGGVGLGCFLGSFTFSFTFFACLSFHSTGGCETFFLPTLTTGGCSFLPASRYGAKRSNCESSF